MQSSAKSSRCTLHTLGPELGPERLQLFNVDSNEVLQLVQVAEAPPKQPSEHSGNAAEVTNGWNALKHAGRRPSCVPPLKSFWQVVLNISAAMHMPGCKIEPEAEVVVVVVVVVAVVIAVGVSPPLPKFEQKWSFLLESSFHAKG